MSISSKPLFIGLAGTLNAGKDSLGEMLAERHGFLHVSTGDMIRQLKREAFGDTPEALVVRNDPFINELREKDPGFLIAAIYKKWQTEKDIYPGGFVASGIRAICEAEKIQELGGGIIFVDASPQVRYERSQMRSRDANEVNKSFEEFMTSEQSEMPSDPDNKFVQNISAMKKMATLVIDNSDQDIEKFKDYAEQLLLSHFT